MYYSRLIGGIFNLCCTLPRRFVFNAGCLEGIIIGIVLRANHGSVVDNGRNLWGSLGVEG